MVTVLIQIKVNLNTEMMIMHHVTLTKTRSIFNLNSTLGILKKYAPSFRKVWGYGTPSSEQGNPPGHFLKLDLCKPIK